MMIDEDSILLDTDAYKLCHWGQYPDKTQSVYSYFESRGGVFKSTVFFGLQYILRKYLTGQVVTEKRIQEAKKICQRVFGRDDLFNEKGWRHILEKRGGRLPVVIKAVPEGTDVNTSNVLFTIENTDPETAWLTNYLETSLMRSWYPTTVASLGSAFYKLWKQYLEKNGTESGITYKLHDFGARGVTCREQAGLGGLSHLLNFNGTDTVEALIFAENFYGDNKAGTSVPATEHSTVMAWGKDGEDEHCANLLKIYPTGIFSTVSDTYDLKDNVTRIWGQALRQKAMEREGIVVIRPDSGNPAEVVLDTLNRLSLTYGFRYNAKGYKILEDHVRILQGDGLDLEVAEDLLRRTHLSGWSCDNFAFGIGGALLQKLNRDTQKFAIKASHVVVDGEGREIFKSPAADTGKKSKAGKLKLLKRDGYFYTVKQSDPGEDHLVEVFRDGEMKRIYTLDECRANLDKSRIYNYPSKLHPELWTR